MMPSSTKMLSAGIRKPLTKDTLLLKTDSVIVITWAMVLIKILSKPLNGSKKLLNKVSCLLSIISASVTDLAGVLP